MSESRMLEVAKMFDVETGELFDIEQVGTGIRCYDYYFSSYGVIHDCDLSRNSFLEDLLTGRARLIKKQWKPKHGDTFYRIGSNTIDNAVVIADIFTGTFYDYDLYAHGNCFRTKVDAEAHRDEIVKKLKDIYEKGEPLCEK